MADFLDNFESTITLASMPEVFVYRIPKLSTASGHRADTWDLPNPVLTGSMKVFSRGDKLVVEIYSTKPKQDGPPGSTTEELFAAAPVDLKNNPGKTIENWVESVTDSSRYFVVRCEDERTKRHAYIGIGFRNRESAIDFKGVLQDYVSSVNRERRAAEMAKQSEVTSNDEEPLNPLQPMQDLTLKDGEKIHLSIGGSSGKKRPPKKKTGGTGQPFLLRPPPPSGDVPAPMRINVPSSTVPATPAQTPVGGAPAPTEAADGDDDDWGDFQG